MNPECEETRKKVSQDLTFLSQKGSLIRISSFTDSLNSLHEGLTNMGSEIGNLLIALRNFHDFVHRDSDTSCSICQAKTTKITPPQ